MIHTARLEFAEKLTPGNRTILDCFPEQIRGLVRPHSSSAASKYTIRSYLNGQSTLNNQVHPLFGARSQRSLLLGVVGGPFLLVAGDWAYGSIQQLQSAQ